MRATVFRGLGDLDVDTLHGQIEVVPTAEEETEPITAEAIMFETDGPKFSVGGPSGTDVGGEIIEFQEETQPVWGKGNLPAEYQEFFGDSNGARMNFVQNQVIENQGKILKIIAVRLLALEGVDPNDLPIIEKEN